MDLTFDITDLSKWNPEEYDVSDEDFFDFESVCKAIASYAGENELHPITALYDYFHDPGMIENYMGAKPADAKLYGSLYVLIIALMCWGSENGLQDYESLVADFDARNVWEWLYMCGKEFYSLDSYHVVRALNNWNV